MSSDVMIRAMESKDTSKIVQFDHGYDTNYVWQMDLHNGDTDVSIRFRVTRLPRTMRVEYPRVAERIATEWKRLPAAMVAEKANSVVGYIGLKQGEMPGLVNIVDLIVEPNERRQGIGTELLLAAQRWATEQGNTRIILEMQSKNYPAICLAQKLGFEFCGYCDQCYLNQDIALFFCRRM